MVFSTGGIGILLTILFFTFKFSLGLIFLFSVMDKIKNRERHLDLLNKYRVLPENLIKVAFPLLIVFEVLITFVLLFWSIHKFVVYLFSVVLIIFSIAIIKNIVAGNTNISCGCGGLLENDKLHFGIVFRNIFFILVFFLLFISEHYNLLLNITLWGKIIIFLLSISLILTMSIGQELSKLRTKKNVILKSIR